MHSVKKIHYKQRRIVRRKNIIITSAKRGKEYREMIAESGKEVKRRESGERKECEEGGKKERDKKNKKNSKKMSKKS